MLLVPAHPLSHQSVVWHGVGSDVGEIEVATPRPLMLQVLVQLIQNHACLLPHVIARLGPL